MSRAFVKDDADDGQVVIPPRTAIPPGVANYVTPRGLGLLRAELLELESERGRIKSVQNRNDSDRARNVAINRGQIQQLEARIASSRLVDPAAQPASEVRFGARVTLELGAESRVVKIVGVDESDASLGLIGFLAPIARSLTGKKLGDEVMWPTPAGSKGFRIVGIEYGE